MRLAPGYLRKVKGPVRGVSKLPKLNLIASTGFENNLGAFAEAFVAQMWPKEKSSNISGFHLGFVCFRNFYDFADFGGFSTLCHTLWEGTRVSSDVLQVSGSLGAPSGKLWTQHGLLRWYRSKSRETQRFAVICLKSEGGVEYSIKVDFLYLTSGAPRWVTDGPRGASGVSSESNKLHRLVTN